MRPHWYALVSGLVCVVTFYGDKPRYFPFREHLIAAVLWLPAALAVVLLVGFLVLSAGIKRCVDLSA